MLKNFTSFLCIITVLCMSITGVIVPGAALAENTYTSYVDEDCEGTLNSLIAGVNLDTQLKSDTDSNGNVNHYLQTAGGQYINKSLTVDELVLEFREKKKEGQKYFYIEVQDSSWATFVSIGLESTTDWKYYRVVMDFDKATTTGEMKTDLYTSTDGKNYIYSKSISATSLNTKVRYIKLKQGCFDDIHFYQYANLRPAKAWLTSSYGKMTASFAYTDESVTWTPTSYEYQWKVSSDGDNFTDILGESSAELSLDDSDTGNYYKCIVTPIIPSHLGEGKAVETAPMVYKGYTDDDVTALITAVKNLETNNMTYDDILTDEVYKRIFGTDIDMSDYETLVGSGAEMNDTIIDNLTDYLVSVNDSNYTDENAVIKHFNIALALELLNNSESPDKTAVVLEKYIDKFDLSGFELKAELDSLSDKADIYKDMHGKVKDIDTFMTSLRDSVIFNYIEASSEASKITELFKKTADIIGIDITRLLLLDDPDSVSAQFAGEEYSDYKTLADEFAKALSEAEQSEIAVAPEYESYISEDFEGEAPSIGIGSHSVTSDAGGKYLTLSGNSQWTINTSIVADNTVFEFKAKPTNGTSIPIVLYANKWSNQISGTITNSGSWKYYRIILNSANAETANDMNIKLYVSDDGKNYTEQTISFTKSNVVGSKTYPIDEFRFRTACVDDLKFYKNADLRKGTAKLTADYEKLTASFTYTGDDVEWASCGYTWQVSDDDVYYEDIDGESDKTISLDSSYRDKYVRCVVKPLISEYPGYSKAQITNAVQYRGYTKDETLGVIASLNSDSANYYSIFTTNADMLELDKEVLDDYTDLDSSAKENLEAQFGSVENYTLGNVNSIFNTTVVAQLLEASDSKDETVNIMEKYIKYFDVNSASFDSLEDKTPVYEGMYGHDYTDAKSVITAIIDSTIMHVVKSPVFISDVTKVLKDNSAVIGISTTAWLSLKNPDAVSSSIKGKEYSSMEKLAEAFDKAVEAQKKLEGLGTDDKKETSSHKPSVSGVSVSGSGNSGAGTTPPVSQPDNAIFNDIAHVSWAHESIEYLYSKGIINGKSEGVFAPDDYVTREEFIKMLVEAFSAKDYDAVCGFDDVGADEWCYKYIALAYRDKLVQGVSDSLFGKGSYITRQDMAVMAMRTLSAYTSLGLGGVSVFADNSDMSDYALEAIGALSTAGVINGVGDNKFMPMANATRAQAAKIIYQMLKLQEV